MRSGLVNGSTRASGVSPRRESAQCVLRSDGFKPDIIEIAA